MICIICDCKSFIVIILNLFSWLLSLVCVQSPGSYCFTAHVGGGLAHFRERKLLLRGCAAPTVSTSIYFPGFNTKLPCKFISKNVITCPNEKQFFIAEHKSCCQLLIVILWNISTVNASDFPPPTTLKCCVDHKQ